MIIGIDLGTTYSLGATLNLDHQPVLLPDNSDKNVLYTPSILHINGNNAFVGQSVMHMLEQNPDLGVIRFFKRHLGDNRTLHMDGQGDVWYPESIAALVAQKNKIRCGGLCGQHRRRSRHHYPGTFQRCAA